MENSSNVTGSGIAPYLQVGASVYNNAANNKAAKEAQMRQQLYNVMNADKTFRMNLDMWNRNNRYNSPIEQMNRLKAAGLNPNLVYGNGAVGNASVQMPKYSQEVADVPSTPMLIPDLMGILSQFQDYKLKKQQMNNLQAQEQAINVSSGIEWLKKSVLEDIDSTSGKQYVKELMETQLDVLRQSNRQKSAEATEKENLNKIFMELQITKNPAVNAILKSILNQF